MENKKQYTAPKMEIIEIDNDISIALNSMPPEGPDELSFYDNSKPFLQNINTLHYI